MRAEMTTPLLGICDRCGRPANNLRHDSQGPIGECCRGETTTGDAA